MTARRWHPVWAIAVDRSRAAARLAARVRELEHDLAVSEARWKATRAHFALAVAQRDRARELAAAAVSQGEWSEWDRDQLSEWGVEG